MARRAKGEGSVATHARKDGRWPATLDLGVINGKRVRRTVYGATKSEAAKKLNDLKRQVGLHRAQPAAQVSVHDYLATWLDAKRGSIAESTWTRYEYTMRLHVLPTLGAVRLSSLTADHLTRLYAQLRASLAPTTVQQVASILSIALNAAVADEVLTRAPQRRARTPRGQRKELHTLRRDEVGRLLRAAEADPFRPLYVLALATGMRRGELLALRWRDVDLERGVLTVARSFGPHGFSRPKSGKSRRVLLAPSAVSTLAALPRPLDDDTLVFHRDDGEPVSLTTLHYAWVAAVRRAGLRPCRFHDCRHTAATLMLEAGVPVKVCSEMLGHASVTITLSLYGHVTETMQDLAVRAMEDVIAPAHRQQSGSVTA